MISDRDLDALRRALDWGRAFQKREPQLKLRSPTLRINARTPHRRDAQSYSERKINK
jgi:hypothetical protein